MSFRTQVLTQLAAINTLLGGEASLLEDSGFRTQVLAYLDSLSLAVGGGMTPAAWDFNFTADGDGYVRATSAVTVDLGGAIGTGTLTYAKSTAGAPDSFAGTTLPTALEEGAFLKVTVSDLSGFKAVQIIRA